MYNISINILIITPIKTNAATTFGDLLDDLEELKEQKEKEIPKHK